jgi:peroxiredoxin
MSGHPHNGPGRSPRRPGEYRDENAVPLRPIVGRDLPRVVLQLAGAEVDLSLYADQYSLVLCVFPALGADVADEHDRARAAEWAVKANALKGMGCLLIAVSGERFSEQKQWQVDVEPKYTVLNDPNFKLAQELGLRTMRRSGRRVYEPVTVIVEERKLVKVFPASTRVQEIWTWLIGRTA